MAFPEDDYSADIDYIKRYGDNPNAPGAAVVNAVDRAAPYNATQDFLNQAAIKGTAAGAVSPGVGQPGSTSVTDQTNLNVAAAMERADLAGRTVQAPLPTVASIAMDEYGQQRQAVDQQRKEIMAKLGIIKPQDAGFSAVVLAGPRDRHQLLENLGALEQQSNRMMHEHHYAAVENAKQVHEQTALETGISIATGKSKILQAIQQANLTHGVGTAEARNAILASATADDPDIKAALGHGKLDTLLKPYTELHDVSEERLAAAIAAHRKATGKEPTSVETTATGGINIRSGDKGGKESAVPAKTMADYTTLKVARAEKQAYLEKEDYAPNADILKEDIRKIDAQLGAVEQQFPSLAPKQAGPTGTTPTGPNAPTIPSTVPPAAQRKAGTTYPTPRGDLKWTGTGWVTP